MSPFPELLVEGFDIEQIWEQLQLQNTPMIKYLSKNVEKFIGKGDMSELVIDSEDEQDSDEIAKDDQEMDEEMQDQVINESDRQSIQQEQDSEESEQEEQISSDIEASDLENDDKPFSNTLHTKKFPKTQVDDQFFSLRQMEAFAEKAELWDHQQGKRETKQENSEGESDEDDEEGASFKLLKKDFDLGLGFLSRDPDDEGSDDDEDLMDEDGDNTNDIMYEDFFGPRETHEPAHSRPDERRNKSSKRTREMAELEYDQEGYYDQVAESSVKSASAIDDLIAEHSNNPVPQDIQDEIVEEKADPNQKKTLFQDEDMEQDKSLSTFEKQQLKLSKQISLLETEAVEPKPWTLMGEASGKSRPLNALLEEDLEVDYAAKPVPIITEETTMSLEDIIKARIKER